MVIGPTPTGAFSCRVVLPKAGWTSFFCIRKGTLRKRWCFCLAFVAVLSLFNISAAQGQVGNCQPYNTCNLWLPVVVSQKALTNPIHQGVATYYDATGAGACSFDPSPDNLMVAAMNAEEFDHSNVCGEYIFVSGPKGAVTVRIVDLCPGCLAGHLDLSKEAFASIAALTQGRVDITWQVTSPDLDGPVSYYFKSGSNPWWTAVQIRNHRNPIAKLEYFNGRQWVSVPRTSYNYFVQSNPGMGPGPYTFRVTDSYGNKLVDSEIPHIENGTVNGAAQFPPGP